ncbi:hypothetical protein DSO57_1005683 [Entomophthora muscae]|uniref:Uncharacterized protein n=1 Tax=Entomophthora muscae TaxID=34485 RepID=A0ACC2TVJ7_9FUNG|nr:hypothetical protein DSO57_1005683 [Entomophthora muscae]
MLPGDRDFSQMASLKNLSDLSPRVQGHLVRVYSTLASMMGTSAAGSLLSIYGYFYMNPLFAALASFVCIIALVILKPSERNQQLRFLLLFLFSLTNGISAAPLIAQTIMFYPGVLPVALTSTSLSFLSFTLCALLSTRRSYIFLGGFLGTALTSLSVLGLSNIFLHNSGLDTLILYAGLLVFGGYVIYDTQLIVERADRNSSDVVSDSLLLFTDLISLFYRIVEVLSRQKDDERRKRRY